MALTDTAVLDLLLTARYVGGPAFRQMESDIAGLVDASSGLEKAGAAFQTLGNLAMIAGTALAVGLGYAAEKAAVYDQSLQRIGATAGLTQPQLQTLSDQAMALSDKWGISSQSIVDGSYFLISGVQSLGYTYNDVINNQILPAFAAYVEASGAGKLGAVDFQTAAQDLPHVLAGMHVPIQQWAQALGQLTVVEAESGLSQQQLLASMTRFAPTAGFLGMDFGQSAALAGALSTLGVSGSGTGGARVGTEEAAALRQMFTNSTGQKALMSLLGTTDPTSLNQFFDKKSGQRNNVTPLLALLYSGLNNPQMTKDPQARLGEMTKLFGATGARAMAELMTPGTGGGPSGFQVFKNEMAAMKTPGLAYDRMLQIAQGQAGGPQAQWEIFKQRLENLALVVGNQVIPALLQFGQWLGTAVTHLREFLQAHPKAIQDTVKAVPALVGGGLGLKGAGGLLSFLGGDLSKVGKHNTREKAEAAAKNASNLAKYEESLGSWKNVVAQGNQQMDETLARDVVRKQGLFEGAHAKWVSGIAGISEKSESTLNHLMADYRQEYNTLPTITPKRGETKAAFAARQRKEIGDYHRMVSRNYKMAHGNAIKDFEAQRLALGPEPQLSSFMTPFEGTLPTMPTMPRRPEEVVPHLQKTLLQRVFSPFVSLAKGGATTARNLAQGVGHGVGAILHGTAPAAIGRGVGDLGTHLKGIATAPLQKLVGLFQALGPALKALPGALVAFSGALLPILAIALVVAGIIAIIILTLTHFRKEAETAGKTIGAGLTPIIKLFGAIFQGAIKQIETAWQKAWPSISTAMQQFFKELPKITPLLKVIGAVLGGVLAVVVAVIVGIANGFIKALPFIIGFVSKVISLFGDVAKFLIDVVKAIFGKGGWGAVGNDLKAIWSDIWGIITNFVGMIVSFLWGFITGVIKFFQHLWDVLVGHSIIPDMINGIISWFQKLPGKVLTFIQQMITNITTAITKFATNILTTAEAVGKNLITGIGNGINGMKTWLGQQLGTAIHVAVGLIPGGTATAHLLGIPGFAYGTSNAPGGFAMVGENGPEMMYVPGGSQVYPHGKGPQQGSNTFWEARAVQSVRESRYGPTQPVTQRSLLGQLDQQYRYSYQYTA